ncbi:galactokinase [Mycolicibacterium litorale]|nr:galactokinase [Mycolicibacterium litorale]
MTSHPVTYAAPGRINLIGEHTDYNLGFALPIALPERTVVRFSPDGSDTVTVGSDREQESAQIALVTRPGDSEGWAAYVAGVIWALRQAGHRVDGGTMSITSDVETGSGLASSAALGCAVLGALITAGGITLDRQDQARIAQRAENEYVGAPTGLLDQIAALYGESSRAMLIDFRDTSVQPVLFDPDAAGLALLVINSRAPHRHAGGEYAKRRDSCERAARDLGVSSLRDVQDRDIDVLDAVSDPLDVRRARHILTENRRVLEFVAAVAAADFDGAGALMSDSHRSMRDDFEITTPQIDLIAETAVAAGALGARMTGGGFGGCVIALVGDSRIADVEDAVRRAMSHGGYAAPAIRRTRASAGAALESVR